MADPVYGPPMRPGNPGLLQRLQGVGDGLLNGLSDEELVQLDDLLGIQAPQLDETQEIVPEQTGGQRFFQSFAGLDNQPQAPARGFAQGLVGGLARGLGSAGSRIEAQRAKLEAGVEERAKARAAANQRATELARAERVGGRRALLMKYIELANREPGAPIAIQTPQGPRYVSRGEAVGQAPAVTKQAPANEPLVQIQGPSGPVWVRRSSAVGKAPPTPTAKPRQITGEQRKNLGYFQRAKDAVDILIAPGDKGDTLESRIAAQNIAQQGQRALLPNFLQGQDQQLYEQAVRAFAAAHLRRESGAQISKLEYETEAKTYFAQPGDKPKTIEQKRRTRQKILDDLKYSAGPAYKDFYEGTEQPAEQEGLQSLVEPD